MLIGLKGSDPLPKTFGKTFDFWVGKDFWKNFWGGKDLLKSPMIKKKIKEIFGEDMKMEEVRIDKIDGQKI